MAITAAQVKELRESTGAGMMECKKALTEANGNMEEAIAVLRKKGAAKADKKAGRIAAEGCIVYSVSPDGKQAAIAEVNCETDFVGREAAFKDFAQSIVDIALANNVSDVEALSELPMPGTEGTVEEARKALITKIGENIKVRRIECVNTTGVIGTYTHGGRIGVLLNLAEGDEALAKDLAMHVAAANPSVVKPEDVSDDLVNKEKEIFTAQAQESGKPAEIIEKMIGGRIKKFLNEISLHGQPFVKDPNQTVEQLLKTKNGAVASFVRFEVGEGIEKKVDNFVEEVHAQARGE